MCCANHYFRGVTPDVVYAAEGNVEFAYTTNDADHTASITISNSNGSTVIDVPSTYEVTNEAGETVVYTVTTIPSGFINNNHAQVQVVNIPATVSDIATDAFYIHNLSVDFDIREINVDEENALYSSIDGVLFSKDQKALVTYPMGKADSDYVIPDGTEVIRKSAFLYNKRLSNVIMADSLVDIKDEAFHYSNISSVLFKNSLTTIGASAFANCKRLRRIELPDGVTSISGGAFNYCNNIETINIPDNLSNTSGPAEIFGCNGIKNITASEECLNYSVRDGLLLSKDGKTLILYPSGREDKYFEIPDYIENIGNKAFTFSRFDNVLIPESVTSIGADAFNRCLNLECIEFPDSVEPIAKSPINSCTSLYKLVIGAGIKKLPNGFAGVCNNLRELVFYGDTTVGTRTFTQATCPNIKTVYGGGPSVAGLAASRGWELVPLSAPAKAEALPDGVYGEAYSTQLRAAGTPAPTWTVVEGKLPDGLKLSKNGLISGRAERAGSFYFTLEAKNSSGELTNDYSIKIDKAEQVINGLEDEYVLEVTTKNKEINISGQESVELVNEVSDESVITADLVQNIVRITAENPGTAMITFKATETKNYKKAVKTVKVTVVKVSQSIRAVESYDKILGDEAFPLAARATTDLSYVSDNDGVASVDESGKVTINGAGTAKITITAAENDIYESAEKVVTVNVAKLDQNVTGTESYDKTYGDAAFNLDAKAETALSYISDNEKVATVDGEGLVKIVGSGTAKITITAAESKEYKAAEMVVTIKVVRKKQSITGTATYNKICGNAAFKLNAKAETALSYVSGNKKVVTVDTKGLVKLVGPGTAKITVKAAQTTGCKAATKTVTVKVGLKKPVLKVKALGNKKVKLTWAKVAGAKQYKVYKYNKTKKKYTLIKTVTKLNLTYKTNKGNQSFKIRAFGAGVYSKYSVVKKVKVK